MQVHQVRIWYAYQTLGQLKWRERAPEGAVAVWCSAKVHVRHLRAKSGITELPPSNESPLLVSRSQILLRCLPAPEE